MIETNTNAIPMDGLLRIRASDREIAEAYLPSPCVQSHAANLMQLPGGDLGCVWFGGTQEGKSDISAYFRLGHVESGRALIRRSGEIGAKSHSIPGA